MLRTKTPFDDRTAVIPYDRRLDVLKAKKLLNPHNVALFDVIFNWIDFHKVVRIGNERYYSGWTRIVSQGEIADSIGAERTWVSRRLKIFEEKGIIKIQRVGSMFRYRVRVYPDALKEKRNAEKAEKQGVLERHSVSEEHSVGETQKCASETQKCASETHIQEEKRETTPLPPPDSNKKTNNNSGKSHKLEGLKKRIAAKKLQDFIKVFAAINPDKESQRRWYGAMAKVVSMIEQDPRMMKTFPEESARLEKTDVVLSRTFKHFEQSGNPPQWPGYLFGVGFNVVSDFYFVGG